MAAPRFLDFLRGDHKPSTATALRAAIESSEAAAKAAVEHLDGLTQQRAAALLDADDGTLDRIEKQIAPAQRDLDRAELAIVELRRRLEEAEARERQEALDRLYEEALAAQARGLELTTRVYPPLAKEMVALAQELLELERQIGAINAKLWEADYGKPSVRPIESEARIRRGLELPGVAFWRRIPLGPAFAGDGLICPEIVVYTTHLPAQKLAVP